MAPEEIKAKVHQTYERAFQGSMSYSRRHPQVDHLFRDLKLYGRDAGADFAVTHLGRIVQDVLDAAGSRQMSLTLHAYEFGKAAIMGLEETLRERTGLRVEVVKSAITLIWAEERAGLI
ncbi:hypothetical protein PMNALOAF_3550 [Methylobacterium adhaesivum]|uniref:Uncharacterized protein n=1 Tax=Methylobacterium adhaesivum TaxID=333297 RepID=A0ABT8BKW4_9HYPH|nr:hypothetical protein [Methylobacterium adhaesivum]MDN3592409.1 hypothetical protein [Methylobacterium adhaesivum]GJD32282.1 hypothetical protein PMNALOAF_3550 [Methylobacterium adhaesivum]